MVFPDISNIHWTRKLINYFISDKKLTIPNHNISQKICFKIFVDQYGQILANMSVNKNTFESLIRDFLNVFKQLHVQKLCRDNYPSDDKRIAETLPKVFMHVHNYNS